MIISRPEIEAALPSYHLGVQIGSGASGVVLSGRHRGLDRPVAVKVMPRGGSGDPDFSAEARLLATLDHPHVVRVFDYVETGTMHVIIMELLPGGTLRARMRDRPLPARLACAVALALAGALDAAHAAGILHRDVKPANVLFAENGSPKMTDFGIAKLIGAENAAVTMTGAVGTPAYMAPEQITAGQVGAVTDLYSLGAVLYEMLAGSPVFSHSTPIMRIFHQKMTEDAPALDAGVASAAIVDVTMRALSRDPAARQPSATAFAADLAHAAAEAFGPTWLADAEVPVYLDDAVRSAARDLTTRLPAPKQPAPDQASSPEPDGWPAAGNRPHRSSAPGPASAPAPAPAPELWHSDPATDPPTETAPREPARAAALDALDYGPPVSAPRGSPFESATAIGYGAPYGVPTPKQTEGGKWENNYSGNQQRAPRLPRLQLAPDSIELGSVQLGHTATARLRVINTGGGELDVNGLECSRGISAWLVERDVLEIVFQADRLGAYSGSVQLATSGGARTVTLGAKVVVASWQPPSPSAETGVNATHRLSLRELGLSAVGQFVTVPTGRKHSVLDRPMTLGRATENDLVVDDELVAPHHAALEIIGDCVVVTDLGSSTGTFLNSELVSRATVAPYDVIATGRHLFRLVEGELVEYVDSADVTFEAQSLTLRVGRKHLLRDVTFRLPDRSLLAIVGPAATGKSTLLDVLAGRRPPNSGTVRYAGIDIYHDSRPLLRRSGYCPPDGPLLASLTVRSTLEYGAALRFPSDVTKIERRTRVDEVLGELGLVRHADTSVSRLSVSQRQRCSIALELLTMPALVCLDEPTLGLDPGAAKEMMAGLRRLADDGRTVVVAGSVQHLELCDFVLVLGYGGCMSYFGPPKEMLPYFGQGDQADVFRELQSTLGRIGAEGFRRSVYYVPAAISAPAARLPAVEVPRGRPPTRRSQALTLAGRTLAVLFANRVDAIVAAFLPFGLGLAARFIFGGSAPLVPNPESRRLLLFVVASACFMGTSNAVSSVGKEWGVYYRERAAGISPAAWLGAKLAVSGGASALQATVLTLVALAGRPQPTAVVLGVPLVESVLAVVAVAVGSAAAGLAVSVLVRGTDRLVIPLVLVTTVQALLSGGWVDLPRTPVLEQLSWVVPARWGYSALAVGYDLAAIVGRSGGNLADPLWSRSGSRWLACLGAVVLLTAIVLMLSWWALRRQDRTGSRLATAGRPRTVTRWARRRGADPLAARMVD